MTDKLQPAVPEPRPPAGRSAAFLTWGLVLLLIGQAIYDAGRQQAIEASLSRFASDDGSGQIAIGGLVTLAAVILLVNGVHRLAKNIDILAATR